MDEATGRWVPVGKCKGTKFDVPNLQKGHKYHFRVKAVNKEGVSEPLQTEKAILAKNPFG